MQQIKIICWIQHFLFIFFLASVWEESLALGNEKADSFLNLASISTKKEKKKSGPYEWNQGVSVSHTYFKDNNEMMFGSWK